MTDDDDLKLNTLHRFVKHSPRLVLHEYSHCEVPAGCGGVVLRWYDPRAGAPATVRTTDGEVWLDGVALASSRVQLAPGQHVLAVHGRGPHVSARLDADEDNELLSGAQFRYVAHDPGPGWQAPDYDDRHWLTGAYDGEVRLRITFTVRG